MTGVWRIILVIPFAFVMACFAASLFLLVALGVEPNPVETSAEFFGKLIVLSLITSMFVGLVAGTPAFVMIVLAEIFGWRSLILQLAVGVGIGVAFFGLAGGGAEPGTVKDMQVGGAAGAVAGFVYWLIAGRKAGLGRRVPRDDNGKEQTPA